MATEVPIQSPGISPELALAYLNATKKRLVPSVYANIQSLLEQPGIQIYQDPRSFLVSTSDINNEGGMIVSAFGQNGNSAELLQRARITGRPERAYESSFEFWQTDGQGRVMHRLSGDGNLYTKRNYSNGLLRKELIVKQGHKDMKFLALRKLVNPYGPASGGVYATVNYIKKGDGTEFTVISSRQAMIVYQVSGTPTETAYYSYDQYADSLVHVSTKVVQHADSFSHQSPYGKITMPNSIKLEDIDIPPVLNEGVNNRDALLRTLLHKISFGY